MAAWMTIAFSNASRVPARGPQAGRSEPSPAPEGAMVKTFSVPKEMHVHTGPARVFEDEPDAIDALIERRIRPGVVMVIRSEGPRWCPSR